MRIFDEHRYVRLRTDTFLNCRKADSFVTIFHLDERGERRGTFVAVTTDNFLAAVSHPLSEF